MNLKSYLLLLIYTLTQSVYAQDVDFEKAEKFTSANLNEYLRGGSIMPRWEEKSSRFIYVDKTQGEDVYYIVDPVKKNKTKIFDNKIFFYKLEKITNTPFDYKARSISFYFDDRSKDNLQFNLSSKRYLYNLKTAEIKEIEVEERKPRAWNEKSWRKYSSDSTYYVFGRNHNLYVQEKDKDEDSAHQLTYDGVEFYSYTSSSPYKRELDADKYMFPSINWAEDSRKFVVLKEDRRKVGEMTIIKSLKEPRPTTDIYKFSMPGDEYVSQFEVLLFDVVTNEKQEINIKKYPDQKIEMIARIYDSYPRYFFFLRKSRTCDNVDLCRLDTKTGEFKELISEETTPHFNVPLFACHILNGGKDILWWSERTGYGQYYLYNSEGKLQNAVTDRNFVAGMVHSIDTIGRSFIFEAYGYNKEIDPYYRMYYKASFDGKKNVLLTPDDGYHDISLSPDRKYIVDTYSRVNMPPKSEVRDMNGRCLISLEDTDVTALIQAGFQYPECIKLKAADDITDLYGVMYKPSDIDVTRKYPIIVNVYPGPIEDYVPKRFTIDDNFDQSLSELGFIVINFGYRGASPYRGRDFHCYGYGNLRDYALPDCKAVIKQLADKYPFIDIDKVGIYGHSGGGFMAATAILEYPDFFKVAVAASGNHDNRIYTQYWGETYQGVKMETVTVKDSLEYKFTVDIPTNLPMAKNLKGRLFLISGDVDVNVHMAQTLRLADALIKENKRFDMMILPNKDHGLGDQYYINLIRYYFVENLLGKKQNHTDIVNHK